MKKEIGQVLKEYRLEIKGRTQGYVAKQLGTKGAHGYISRIELGKGGSIEYIEKLLIFYGKKESDFFLKILSLYLDKSPKN